MLLGRVESTSMARFLCLARALMRVTDRRDVRTAMRLVAGRVRGVGWPSRWLSRVSVLSPSTLLASADACPSGAQRPDLLALSDANFALLSRQILASSCLLPPQIEQRGKNLRP